ncbi:3-methyl-2-oxobutanoate dehydrogenase [Zobellella denitrificans]|jgi:2-oxoisovalerate dehydrogenase E1 component alpha subunit|uniref:thiamine pyrophosphate-dependent dehydrogenase E1 component subunit alpha n=1 Tax=Zobellella denitrificans TaxID=347534 RepID=UPI000B8BF92A|nr:thiamine pyrophosphate-dependent dehydrogenase E1 component subunit alpha [Zobellella denitrificans]OXS15758.1 3-methyl-2-oxobutanoate dehydrogenase [Zobellella denitrificans]
MTNPSNASTTTVHQAQFTGAHALSIPTLRILQDDGTLFAGASPPVLDRDTALHIYDSMVFIRVLDERMLAAQRQGRISFYMQCLGEEAAAVASAAALDRHDMIMAQYREQGALRYRGFTLEQFMNQLFSNERDLGKGRQMPVHYGSRDIRFMTISSPLGTQIPQASGYAYAQRLKGESNTTLCYFGEGAASEGDFHAGLNMAAVLRAPVIFFCRNNGYAISTPASEQFIGDGIACRAVGYGIQAIRVDGADALAVYEATRLARKLALEQQEPVLVEAIAYRLGAHSSSDDPSGYRSREEEERWRKQDPIARFRRWLLNQGWLDEAADQIATDALRQEVLEAVKEAEQVPKPRLDSLIEDVYAEPPPALKAQLEALREHIRRYPDAYPVTSGRLD